MCILISFMDSMHNRCYSQGLSTKNLGIYAKSAIFGQKRDFLPFHAFRQGSATRHAMNLKFCQNDHKACTKKVIYHFFDFLSLFKFTAKMAQKKPQLGLFLDFLAPFWP